MKKCNRCNIEKELVDFRRRFDSKDGRRSECRECSSMLEKKNREEFHDSVRNREILSYHRNKDKWKESRKKYRDKNKDKLKDYMRQYRIENKSRIREMQNDWVLKRSKVDRVFKLSNVIRRIINTAVCRSGFSKSIRTEEILGCSVIEFKIYLESKFDTWMNWDNHGLYNGISNYGWDIDHIMPISSAETEDDVIKLNHYTNFQPLCSYINRCVKKDKLDYEKN